MVDIQITVIDEAGTADTVARRLLRDFRDTDGIGGAELVRRPGAEGERGIVDDIGAVAATVLSSGGVEALMALAGSVLPRQGNRKLVFKLGDGTVFELEGPGVSGEQFNKVTDALLARIVNKGDETP